MATLLGALPPGSYLALSRPAKDIDAASMAKDGEALLACFAPDAVVDDFGRRFAGRLPTYPSAMSSVRHQFTKRKSR